jgi:hypothetical protein
MNTACALVIAGGGLIRPDFLCRIGVHERLGVDMGESKRAIDSVRSFWMDTIFIALGMIALFAGVALGLAILMAA